MDIEDRVRLLERELSRSDATTAALDGQMKSAWREIAKLREAQAKEYREMRADMHETRDELLAAITANKIGSAAMNATGKAIAWILLAVLTAGSTIAGIAVAVKKIFFS